MFSLVLLDSCCCSHRSKTTHYSINNNFRSIFFLPTSQSMYLILHLASYDGHDSVSQTANRSISPLIKTSHNMSERMSMFVDRRLLCRFFYLFFYSSSSESNKYGENSKMKCVLSRYGWSSVCVCIVLCVHFKISIRQLSLSDLTTVFFFFSMDFFFSNIWELLCVCIRPITVNAVSFIFQVAPYTFNHFSLMPANFRAVAVVVVALWWIVAAIQLFHQRYELCVWRVQFNKLKGAQHTFSLRWNVELSNIYHLDVMCCS